MSTPKEVAEHNPGGKDARKCTSHGGKSGAWQLGTLLGQAIKVNPLPLTARQVIIRAFDLGS